jgi:hypothetical protein
VKILYPSNVNSITADEENADYPVSNVENDYVEEVWKATTNTARVTLNLSRGNGCFVYGTNATGITVTVVDDAAGIEEELSGSAVTFGTSNGKGALWADYTAIAVAHTIKLDFVAAAGTIIEAGIIRAGDVSSFRDPSRGIQEGLKDLSVMKDLGEGGRYYKKQAVIRTFNFSVTAARDIDFYTFMRDIIQERGCAALPWRLITKSLTDWEWIVFANTEEMPRGYHGAPAHSKLDITLLEAMAIGNQSVTFGGEGVTFGGEGVTFGGEVMPLGGEGVTFGGEGVTFGGEEVIL